MDEEEVQGAQNYSEKLLVVAAEKFWVRGGHGLPLCHHW